MRVAGAAAGVLALGAAAWLVPRATATPAAAPVAATPAARPAPVARLERVGPGDTPVSLAVEVAVAAAAGGSGAALTTGTVWSGRFDTGPAGVVDAVVVAVVLPDGTELRSTAFAQGRENQMFLLAPCGVQPAAAVTAARCSTADLATGVTTATVLVTGLTAPATLLGPDDVPLATLTPGADGTTTARDDDQQAETLRLADGQLLPVTSP